MMFPRDGDDFRCFFCFFLVAFLLDWEGNRFDMISFGEFTRYDGEGVPN